MDSVRKTLARADTSRPLNVLRDQIKPEHDQRMTLTTILKRSMEKCHLRQFHLKLKLYTKRESSYTWNGEH